MRTPRDLTDAQLVAVIQSTDDQAAFKALATRHASALTSFVQSMARDAVDVDDVVQAALYNAYANIAQFEGRSGFRTWLFQIAYREHLKARKKATRQSQLKQAAISHAATRQSADDLKHVSRRVDITNALERLTSDERTALLLCDAYGFTHQEAAETMGAPLGTVKSFVSRARRRMRNLLEVQNDR